MSCKILGPILGIRNRVLLEFKQSGTIKTEDGRVSAPVFAYKPVVVEVPPVYKKLVFDTSQELVDLGDRPGNEKLKSGKIFFISGLSPNGPFSSIPDETQPPMYVHLGKQVNLRESMVWASNLLRRLPDKNTFIQFETVGLDQEQRDRLGALWGTLPDTVSRKDAQDIIVAVFASVYRRTWSHERYSRMWSTAMHIMIPGTTETFYWQAKYDKAYMAESDAYMLSFCSHQAYLEYAHALSTGDDPRHFYWRLGFGSVHIIGLDTMFPNSVSRNPASALLGSFQREALHKSMVTPLSGADVILVACSIPPERMNDERSAHFYNDQIYLLRWATAWTSLGKKVIFISAADKNIYAGWNEISDGACKFLSVRSGPCEGGFHDLPKIAPRMDGQGHVVAEFSCKAKSSMFRKYNIACFDMSSRDITYNVQTL